MREENKKYNREMQNIYTISKQNSSVLEATNGIRRSAGILSVHKHLLYNTARTMALRYSEVALEYTFCVCRNNVFVFTTLWKVSRESNMKIICNVTSNVIRHLIIEVISNSNPLHFCVSNV